MDNEEKHRRRAPPVIEWREVAHSAASSAFVAGVIGGGLYILRKLMEAEEALPIDDWRNAGADDDGDLDVEDEDAELLTAADVLGVSLDASEDEIRAALRARLAYSNVHPDHGGDGEEAKRLIAAKNLLIAWARAHAQSQRDQFNEE